MCIYSFDPTLDCIETAAYRHLVVKLKITTRASILFSVSQHVCELQLCHASMLQALTPERQKRLVAYQDMFQTLGRGWWPKPASLRKTRENPFFRGDSNSYNSFHSLVFAPAHAHTHSSLVPHLSSNSAPADTGSTLTSSSSKFPLNSIVTLGGSEMHTAATELQQSCNRAASCNMSDGSEMHERGGGTHTLQQSCNRAATELTLDGSEMHARGGGPHTLTPVASECLAAPQSTHTVGGCRAHSCNRAATELQQSCELQHILSQPQQSVSCNNAVLASIASDRASRCCDFQRSDEADELQQSCNRAATDEPSDRASRCDLHRSDLLAQCLQEDGVDPCFTIEKRLAEHEADEPPPLQQSCNRPLNGNRQVQLPPHVRDRIFQLMILHCRYPSGTHFTCFTRLY